MAISEQYQADAAVILSHRHDNGGDLWTTPDSRILKGGPFSTVECVGYLRELGMEQSEPVLRQAAELIFSAWQEDGRFKVYPSGGIRRFCIIWDERKETAPCEMCISRGLLFI